MNVTAWKAYIDELRDSERDAYLRTPARLTAAYNQECALTSDYHGREILELLQNADDHGPKGRNGRVHIELVDGGLCFANTGMAFPREGVESLVIPNHSPKALDRKRFIGNKGLGFRAILNWTEAPFILSDDLHLGFSRAYAIEWMRELCQQEPRVAQEVTKHEDAGYHDPVATLACPFVPDKHSGDIELYRLAMHIRSQGYRTVIGLPLSPQKVAEAYSQLKKLVPETLLFLNSVTEVCISAPALISKLIVRKNRGKLTASINGKHYNRWALRTAEGKLPPELIDERAPANFQVSVALPEHGEGPGVLFNYLPTTCRFPLPVLAHASLLTDQSRNHIVRSDANEYVLGALANLLADVASDRAQETKSWVGAELISPRGDFDPVIDTANFIGRVYERVASLPVVPCLDNKCRLPSQSRSITFPIHKQLTGSRFANIASPVPPSVDVKRLGLQPLSPQELCDNLSAISGRLSHEDRVAIMVAFNENDWLQRLPVPDLLVDGSGKVIPAHSRALLPPSEEADISLPDWVPVRIVNKRLTLMLRQAFRVKTDPELIGRLGGYNIRRYAFEVLAAAIISEGNRLARDQPDNEHRVRLQVVHAVYDLFAAASLKLAPPPLRDTSLMLPTCDGGFLPGTHLYFGQGYKEGALNADLFRGVTPSCFVEAAGGLGIGDSPTPFLIWAGVATRPRIIKTDASGSDFGGYIKAVCRSFKQPYVFSPNDFTGDTPEGLLRSRATVHNVSVPEHFEALIKFGRPEAILAWLASDEVLLRLANSTGEGEFSVIFGQKSNRRVLQNQSPPQLTWWRLRSATWMPTYDGTLRRPGELAIGASGSEELLKLLPPPTLDLETTAAHNVVHPAIVGIEEVLKRLGVAASVTDVSWDTLFSIASRMPGQSPDGALTRGLYMAMLTKVARYGDPPSSPPADLPLWGQHFGSKNYFPASELRYNSHHIISEALARHLKLLHLPRKQGGKQVMAALGVPTLSAQDVKLSVTSFQPATGAEKIVNHMAALRPFALALRRNSDATATARKRLRDFKLTVCNVIAASAVVGGQEIQLTLSTDGEYVIQQDGCYLVLSKEAIGRGPRDAVVATHLVNLLSALLDSDGMAELLGVAVAARAQRRELLRQAIGEQADELLDWAASRLNIDIDDGIIGILSPAEVAPGSAHGSDGKNLQKEREAQPSKQSSSNDSVPAEAPTTVLDLDSAISEKRHMPVGSARPPVPLRYNPTRGKIGPPRIPRQVDPRRCQDIAAAFERSQGRHPLAVDGTQGHKGPGCDILSFDSDRKLKQFKKSHATRLVSRFIEVKGSALPKSTITLGGNELDSAETNGDRFYVYRVHEDESRGVAAIVTLRDPAANPKARSIEVDPYVQRDEVELWELSS